MLMLMLMLCRISPYCFSRWRRPNCSGSFPGQWSPMVLSNWGFPQLSNNAIAAAGSGPAMPVPAVDWGLGPRLKNLVKVKPPFERPGRSRAGQSL